MISEEQIDNWIKQINLSAVFINDFIVITKYMNNHLNTKYVNFK